MAEEFADEAIPPSGGVGAQLRAAREARGLTLEEVAAETRIPQRHLATIEEGDFAQLPARTYAIGFARSYAKLVGLHQDDVVKMVRAELDAQEPQARQRTASFEPGDPARVPSRALGWFSAFALLLLIAGGFFAFRTYFAPAGELPSLVEQQQAERAAQQTAATAQPTGAAGQTPSGPVVFTALEEGIWVKFYDANGAQLLQKLMAEGERYTVPADANGPQLWTGRPDALAITIGGRTIPKLSDDDVVMRDVPISAEALLARSRPPTAPTAAATPAASPTA